MHRFINAAGAALLTAAALVGCQTSEPEGRQDVIEITQPPLPTGPGNPDPACHPDNPQC
jgi:hypothetical protein